MLGAENFAGFDDYAGISEKAERMIKLTGFASDMRIRIKIRAMAKKRATLSCKDAKKSFRNPIFQDLKLCGLSVFARNFVLGFDPVFDSNLYSLLRCYNEVLSHGTWFASYEGRQEGTCIKEFT